MKTYIDPRGVTILTRIVRIASLSLWIPFAHLVLQSGLLEEATAAPPAGAAEELTLQHAASLGMLQLSLREAVRLALENNPTLKIEKIRVAQARTRVDQEQGDFDPVFNADSSVLSRDNIIASRFYPSGLYTDKQATQTLGVESRTQTGGVVNAGVNYAALRSDSNIQTLSPQYNANLSFSFEQPLLRDFGSGASRTRLRVSEKDTVIAEHNLSTRLSQLIQRVEETYWNLTFLLQDLEGKLRNFAAARQFLTQNENLLRAGRVAPVSVLQARAAVAERERDVITSRTAVEDYKDRLKNRLWLDLDATDLIPTDAPALPPIALDADRSLQAALSRRPELQALNREQEQRAIEVKYAVNQTRPRLDLTAQFSTAGLSGRPNPACIDPTVPECIPVGSNVNGSVLAGRTSPTDALADLISRNPYESWSVQLTFQLPIGNRTAKARRAEASLRELETRANVIAMRDQVAMDIRSAIREVQASEKRVEASREAVRYLENQLEGMRTQLKAGLVSSYDVLQAFEEVDRARTTELQAMMDFNVALSR